MPAHHERGAILDALTHALRLYGLKLVAADCHPEAISTDCTDAPEHRRLADDAQSALTQAAPGARLPTLARAMRAWLVADRPHAAVRAALPATLQATGVTRTLPPTLTGASTLRPDSL